MSGLQSMAAVFRAADRLDRAWPDWAEFVADRLPVDDDGSRVLDTEEYEKDPISILSNHAESRGVERLRLLLADMLTAEYGYKPFDHERDADEQEAWNTLNRNWCIAIQQRLDREQSGG